MATVAMAWSMTQEWNRTHGLGNRGKVNQAVEAVRVELNADKVGYERALSAETCHWSLG